MAIAEGRTIPFVGPEAVDVAVLETFEYAGPDQEIVTETREFSPVCPYSGLPDFATLRITYVPSDRCIELKSLKYYVTSYRNVGIFQEHATAKIAEDLQRALGAKRLMVTTIYNHAGWVRHHLHGGAAGVGQTVTRAKRGVYRHGPRSAQGDSYLAVTAAEGVVGTVSGPGFGPRGSSSPRFASSHAVTAITALACRRSSATALS